ncbi:bifunctional glutamate N-acetyltransferase/amino-acid acetyltransferase ArgJ [Ferrimicrobium sp.]|uniref:bifunctional glutamate N-acetyltransferase/amino-acid acetyltransferase ArgJ n=1 Tax=Ferrimicrobium sp. TaxID=2926050 RepID=UPI00262B38D0|nr:bifunctional glutamate N-acetyltransferase/amino-acid acetyltransferase ArgJ [Ferrimicrobium sp.]
MSVTFPEGIRAAGVAAGIKPGGALDLAFVGFSDGDAHVGAAVFTQSAAAAAPVRVSRDHLSSSTGHIRGVVLSSGNANALTGEAGLAAAKLMASSAAAQLGGVDHEYLVCSTGLIGIPFPAERIEPGLELLAGELGTDSHAGERAAHAIRTTDTFAKEAQAVSDGFRVGGMAKGAAMIAPNMATMLCVLTTDAKLTPQRAQSALGWVVDQTFNRITIDGCTSTNDTVILLASEVGGDPGPDFEESLLEVAAKLAYSIVADAEGGSRVGRIRVGGGATVEEAERCARGVASSLLVKCSLLGGDPYWGRVLAEVGAAVVDVDMTRVSVAYQGVRVCEGGLDASAHLSVAERRHLDQRMREREIIIEIDLGRGDETVEVLTADIGHGYLEENRGTS